MFRHSSLFRFPDFLGFSLILFVTYFPYLILPPFFFYYFSFPPLPNSSFSLLPLPRPPLLSSPPPSPPLSPLPFSGLPHRSRVFKLAEILRLPMNYAWLAPSPAARLAKMEGGDILTPPRSRGEEEERGDVFSFPFLRVHLFFISLFLIDLYVFWC